MNNRLRPSGPLVVPSPTGSATGPGPLGRLAGLYRSSVGRKYVMALSGLAILGFVIAHLVGTLKVFLGPGETDAYGEALRALGGDLVPRTHLLWIFRISLALAFAVHLHAAFTLDRRNRRAAAETGGSRAEYLAATYASRTMLSSGVIVGLFIVFHIADLTFGSTNPEFVRGEVYDNQINSFRNPAITAIYLAGVAALAIHLFHGLWSLFQTLGVTSPWLPGRTRRRIAVGVATLIGAGYASIPVAVVTGVLDHA